MKNSMLRPCTDWVEKLVVRNSDDLSYSQRVALNEHLAACSACDTTYANNQVICNCLASLPAVEPLADLPYELLPMERSIPRGERARLMFSVILTRLKSLPAAFARFLQKNNYASSANHDFYAVRDGSGFLLWKYKKSNVLFSAAPVANGVVYVSAFDAEVFLFASALRSRLSSYSFLWR